MPVRAWSDDFTSDHFTDGRYHVYAGEYGSSFAIGDYGGHHGLGLTFGGWTDPTSEIGGGAWVEMDFQNWSVAPRLLMVGFAPVLSPDLNSSPLGVWLTDTGDQILSEGVGTQLAAIFATRHAVPADALLRLRLTVDGDGNVMYGIGAKDGTIQGDGADGFVAYTLGGYGKLSSEVLAALPSFVPVGYFASSGVDPVITRWAYGPLTGAVAQPPSVVLVGAQQSGCVAGVPVRGGIGNRNAP